MRNSLYVVAADDSWTGLYIGGELLEEGEAVFKENRVEFPGEVVILNHTDTMSLDEKGHFPKNIKSFSTFVGK